MKAAAANKFDLIRLDCNMPNLSGFEALKAIKANPATKSIPVIMTTSEADFPFISNLLFDRLGIRLEKEKGYLVESRLAKLRKARASPASSGSSCF